MRLMWLSWIWTEEKQLFGRFQKDFLVAGHLGEGLLQLLGDPLQLLLLGHKLVLQPVNLNSVAD